MSKVNRIERSDKFVMNASMVVLLLWASILFTNLNGDPGFAVRHLGISIFCTFYLAHFFVRRKLEFPKLSVRQLVAVSSYGIFSLIGLLSAGAGINFTEGVFPFLININFLIIIIVSIHAFSSGLNLNSIAYIITIIGGVMGVIGILQFYELLPEALIAGSPPTALQFNRNFFASAQVLSLPFGVVAAIYLRSARQYISIAFLSIIIWSIAISQTRSAVLSLLIFGLIVVVGLLKSYVFNKSIEIRKSVVLTMIIACLAGGITLGVNYFDNIPRGLKDYAKKENMFHRQTSIEERLTIWEGSIKILSDHWFKGVGFGNWKIHYASIAQQPNRAKSGRVVISKAHNVYLEYLCETGMIGFICFAIFLVSVFLILINTGMRTTYGLIFGAGFLGFLSDFLFSFGNYQPTHMVYSGIMLGYLLNLDGESRLIPNIKPVFKFLLWVGIGTSLFAAYWSYSFMRFEQNIERGQQSSASNEYQMAHYYLDNAINSVHSLNRQGDSPYLQKAIVFNKMNQHGAAINNLNNAWKDNPLSPRLNATYGSSYFALGEIEKASIYYQKAFDILSANNAIAQKLAVYHFEKKDFKKCVEILEPFEKRLDPNLEFMLRFSRMRTGQQSN